MRVGIIGSSVLENKNIESYEMAVEAVKQEIDLLNIPYKNIVLVSGGSSWADHIAVTLYNRLRTDGMGLTLYLPTDMTNHEYNSKTYFGRELNLRHRAFSKSCFSSENLSLVELFEIIELSKLFEKQTLDVETLPKVNIVIEKKGFKARNTLISNNIDFLIAVSNTAEVSGGTKDTWMKFKVPTSKKLLFF